MFLEKLEIQGFKSFANKNVLKFDIDGNGKKGKKVGLTVIVGPNGSGKSNVADAVRWVLGEQSLKLLRGKKSEDVIFSGSNKKASLSFSEVSLYLNNDPSFANASEGKDQIAPIDFREVVITRRLYRDGESEYLLNGSRVRLLDINMLLAKCKFGQRAYSVIGQGMVENFLNTTMAERKEFFDEATGVKMFQIKKEESLNKLRNAQNNLDQAASLLSEIEPRLRSLTRQIKKLEKRAEFEKELTQKQKDYYSSLWHNLNRELKKVNKELIKYEDVRRQQESGLARVNQELKKYQLGQFQDNEYDELLDKQKKLQEERSELGQKWAEIKAKVSIGYETKGKLDLAWLIRQEERLEKEINNLKQEVKDTEIAKNQSQAESEKLKTAQNNLDKELSTWKSKIINQSDANGSDSALVDKARTKIEKITKINEMILENIDGGNLEKLKNLASDLKNELQELKKYFSQNQKDENFFAAQKQISSLEEERLKLTEDYINQQAKVKSAGEKLDYLQIQIKNKSKQAEEIRAKSVLQNGGRKDATNSLVQAEKELKIKIANIAKELADAIDKINQVNKEEAGKRDKVIELQKQAQELQSEYNQNSNALNETKIARARVETKLEDLENEIRSETKNLRMITDNQNFDENVDREKVKEEIDKLKRQLELIGGIDPETAKEYSETKERFDFLDKQSADLKSAIHSLEKVIEQLDKTIDERFDKKFKEIAVTFEKYFKILFNGGSAKLIKIMSPSAEASGDKEDSDVEIIEVVEKKQSIFRKTKQVLSGIEIQATPPGKKIKSISMLSGGERALTAIALISAIISVNPSPFVVLDEVDAALDEANSERLGRVLDDLSNKTQFIIITHNRTIMYKANIIYGITMGDDGISKLLSLKIEEAVTAIQ